MGPPPFFFGARTGRSPEMIQRLVLLAPVLLLAACGGPKLDGEVVAGRTVMITNREDQPVTIGRIVANDADGREECTDAPGTALPPGRSYTTTFFLCDEVKGVAVETDQGTRKIGFE